VEESVGGKGLLLVELAKKVLVESPENKGESPVPPHVGRTGEASAQSRRQGEGQNAKS